MVMARPRLLCGGHAHGPPRATAAVPEGAENKGGALSGNSPAEYPEILRQHSGNAPEMLRKCSGRIPEILPYYFMAHGRNPRPSTHHQAALVKLGGE